MTDKPKELKWKMFLIWESHKSNLDSFLEL